MGLVAKKKSGSSFPPVAQGLYRSICVFIIDIGTQYNEKHKNSSHKVYLGFELPDETIELEIDGKTEIKRRLQSRIFTLSLSDKANLKPFLETWRSTGFTKEELEGFDISKLLGAPAEIQILHETKGDKTYANLTTAIRYKGDKITPEQEPTLYIIEDNGVNIPESVPNWVQDLIKKSEEWKALTDGAPAAATPAPEESPTPGNEEEDDLPF